MKQHLHGQHKITIYPQEFNLGYLLRPISPMLSHYDQDNTLLWMENASSYADNLLQPSLQRQFPRYNRIQTLTCVSDEESSSENSVNAFHHCYISPEPSKSNAESVQRAEEINERIRLRKLKRKQYKQHVQTVTLDDLNPHGLYPHHDPTTRTTYNRHL
jgi:hypothetical protein